MTTHVAPYERGTVIVIPAVALLFLVLAGFMLFLFVAQSDFAYAGKLSAEFISARTHESLVVTRSSGGIQILNCGSVPSVVVAVLGGQVVVDNTRFTPINVLDNRFIPLSENRLRENTLGGVVTLFGNVFWEAQFDFEVRVGSSDNFQVRVPPSGENQVGVAVNVLSGSARTVFLDNNKVSGLPPNTTVTFTPTSGFPSFSSTLTITASSAPSGQYNVTVTGGGGGENRTRTFTLVVGI